MRNGESMAKSHQAAVVIESTLSFCIGVSTSKYLCCILSLYDIAEKSEQHQFNVDGQNNNVMQ